MVRVDTRLSETDYRRLSEIARSRQWSIMQTARAMIQRGMQLETERPAQ